jgi:hypothetical protein
MADNQHQTPQSDDSAATEHEIDATPEDGESPEREFKLTIRKLQLPVRPRGVLAE